MNISCVNPVSTSYQTSATDGFNQLFSDFKNIGSSIQSGDLTSAQSALTTFESDLQNNTGKNPLSQLFSNNSTLSNDLAALQTALKSNDTTGAQSAFKTLIQDMQSAMKTQGPHRRHHHHHHRVDNDSKTSSSTSSTDSSANSSPTAGTLDVQA